ncbi:hypothetical protein [Teichococcus coralli]|uniref:hypothetical protein n=1 Tax=Teichococcus coralli TaxID=2545983 RepID=UPI001F3DEEFC|nr:hypothetical protein [Pseudoroseomonas coralli]
MPRSVSAAPASTPISSSRSLPGTGRVRVPCAMVAMPWVAPCSGARMLRRTVSASTMPSASSEAATSSISSPESLSA